MKFQEVKKGDIIYYANIKDTEIENGKIQKKVVNEVKSSSAINTVEIYFSDNTMVIPDKKQESIIRGIGTLANLLEPFNFTIYSTSYDACAKILRNIVSTKISQITEDYKKINIQMSRLCLMSSILREIEKKSSVVLEPVYAD